MAWELTGDVDHFATSAGGFLRSRPVRHTVLLTLVDTLQRRGLQAYGEGIPVFGFWRTGGVVTGVLVRTPPHPMIFSEMPSAAVVPAVGILADLSGLSRLSPARVNLLADVADEFAAAWQRRTGAVPIFGRRLRLHRLETLISPVSRPPGKPRAARPDDRALLVRWTREFLDEIGEPGADVEAMTEDKLSYGGITLWEDGGEPVSMAAISRPSSGMIRIQTVFTPPDLRGHGYAAGATFAATQNALASGARDVLLNTDLANPTPNRLYSRLGYRPVEDRTVVEFPS